ncbi:MAG: hypothetical protein OIF55_16590 [Amphritea sp.]|nr:hypothetical protein [Amphritea sp.]
MPGVKKGLALTALTVCLAGCGNMLQTDRPAPEPEVYAGQGGMTEWNIMPDAYLYHYENGFTGDDALGYAPQLQTVWSRLGAAETCGISYDKALMISLLSARFGESRITHELNGIGFHAVQTRKVPGFCSEKRVPKIMRSLNRYREGLFES